MFVNATGTGVDASPRIRAMSVIPREPIHTERLVLEPVSHGHDNDLLAAALASRFELLPWMPWAVDLSLEHQSAYTDDHAMPAWAAGSPPFAITEHGEAIGVIGLDRRSASEYEIHYWLRTDRTGRGYVTEAARGLLSWARDVLGARRIVLNAGTENRRSLAVAAALGFTRDGELEGGMAGGSVVLFPAYTHHLDL
jgi:ribosomal-protein-serine acetyltransferase